MNEIDKLIILEMSLEIFVYYKMVKFWGTNLIINGNVKIKSCVAVVEFLILLNFVVSGTFMWFRCSNNLQICVELGI